MRDRGIGPDLPSLTLDKCFRDRQSQSCPCHMVSRALAAGVASVKAFKHKGQVVGRNTSAGVLNRKVHVTPIGRAINRCRHADRFAAGRMLERIAKKIVQDLLQAVWIGSHIEIGCGWINLQLNPFLLRNRCVKFGQMSQDASNGQWLALESKASRFSLRQFMQIGDQTAEKLRFSQQSLDFFMVERVYAIQNGLQIAMNHANGRA